MTRLFLITLLVLSSGSAYAEWVEVSSSQGAGGFTVYVDSDTIPRKGDRVKMWELYDFKTVQTIYGKPLLSFKRQSEYDCTEERVRLLAYMEHSGNMGEGDTVASGSTGGQWKPVGPVTVDQVLWKLACDKK
jgi:hypothetical protein